MDAKQLGQRIREAREAKGLSQEQLAELISRNQHSVSEYESGKRRIYANDLPSIAHVLGVSVIYFFQDVMSEDDLDTVLLDEFHQLDREARQTLIEMARLLSKLRANR